ncbi:hypothetical protein SAMN04488564_1032 [Lentzea waywayandensis]|uniref:Uncharacterized protein n=1 Tax=Lentzea waywayandensis TaxID=84724 RepID=A0A1I6DTP0_9PSEU|nr:hypothetical protein [Lentzea waywayandensis]SFR08737.1 hypothetical protein SAMN04488564_1032 [Lentzea waywayandensis]
MWFRQAGARMAGPRSKVELFAAIRRDSRTESCRSLTSPWPAPRKQRHTAKRVFDRLVNEHGMDNVSEH